MRKIIYIYVLESMAEWEVGNILQGISMESMLKEQREFEVKTLGVNRDGIKTIGGLTIVPDCTLDEVDDRNIAALLLPGAQTWEDKENGLILEKVSEYLDRGILVGAICGATVPLACKGILNRHKHTSNSVDYLKGFAKDYRGEALYVESPAVRDRNLITASSAGGLIWAKYILQWLGVYNEDKIEAWYEYFSTGKAEYFLKLLE